MTMSDRADALEHEMSMELERVITRSVLYTSGERDPTGPLEKPSSKLLPGQLVLQGHDQYPGRGAES